MVTHTHHDLARGLVVYYILSLTNQRYHINCDGNT